MRIIVIGGEGLFNELKTKLGNSHDYVHVLSGEVLETSEEADIAVDFTIDESPENLAGLLENVRARLYLVNVIKSSLTENSYYLAPSLPLSVLSYPASFQAVLSLLW